ncbi:MAG TPA: SDR family NAD(P)-dependent oxidoreductase [Dehalococcoidia bacterium]|jgi:3-oxoacyl-[acyl-carrier protein] reductase|nr:3-oxoacyl-ACP reductase [Chloroflexota bacterium]MDP5877052.1 SDR family NAD(P)-dependent oxidoreductase [Dehalococcoidia bacterium]MDP7161444.1 SDR family NAD(P)-dependent oxidoreductase [Dehalococcoidia bacterium]MDP7213027.1 SDR family NAD(P)-dependent oxidoreductase [Dehalococcoidia bacterium]MDP7514509.1 SDR family NAD(P)-dependent oxidoreductase [Dehalococcoidia bacterium]|tara:strand:+ start:950 stop:1747 length:798 start_codon:yes stop_codon:yes gene_type:complete
MSLASTTFEGKTAIITGAAQGIGRAVAFDLSSKGVYLLLADIQSAKVESVAAEIRGAGGTATATSVDVTDSASVAEMVSLALTEFDQVDILVNDAGGSGTEGVLRIEDVTEDRWDAQVDLNLKGAFLCCKTIVPHMRSRRYGRIVNLSSSNAKGHFGPLNTSGIRLPYAAAKAGIIGLTAQLARDLGRSGIYVNAVLPGFILTEEGARVRGRYEEMQRASQEAMAEAVPLGRPGRAEEVAKAVAFLASDDASYITGTVVEVTGGR